MGRRWRTFRSLTWAERSVVFQAIVLLPLAKFLLGSFGFKRLSPLLRRTGHRGSLPQGADAPGFARRVGALVDTTSTRGPYRANCLERSLVLWWLLGRRGVPTSLRIGSRRSEEAGLPDFHAWVEFQNIVLNDHHDVASRFQPFPRPLLFADPISAQVYPAEELSDDIVEQVAQAGRTRDHH